MLPHKFGVVHVLPPNVLDHPGFDKRQSLVCRIFTLFGTPIKVRAFVEAVAVGTLVRFEEGVAGLQQQPLLVRAMKGLVFDQRLQGLIGHDQLAAFDVVLQFIDEIDEAAMLFIDRCDTDFQFF